ncbi:phosphate ABC transporter permease subunit PstC [Borrelia turicatae]|uniref:Phosphate transport system permease protein n=2 Tax=Borrelia turicatae TaxID=142 RepID=A0A172XAM6_BORTU|nr:phosphate ABC transporter permease subunit PstC [Borrelia turicatae]AAX17552.1 phosphate transport system permease protein PstC [Borrelia turicatae 91E135]ANF33711.1 phosphate ABC transporter permease subunit PstC [Borrelia turicatae]UPA13081.1 phosphate ABC transporter permease subunit PstC [Borrelia turicatae 91E135]UPA14566.1 phosphate ABC transporter permease subunit PstC [Borrelia turicatae]
MKLTLKTKRNIVRLAFNCFIFTSAIISTLTILLLVLFIIKNGLAPLLNNKIKIFNFLFSTNWDPTNKLQKSYGILSFIINSALTTFFSVLIALPIGLGFAIYLSEKTKGIYQKTLQTIIELLAGIPSVVYGFFGSTFIATLIKNTFSREDNLGYNLITSVIVLSIMILPTIISVSYTSLKAVPKSYKLASLALAATDWQTIYKVMIPSAGKGILAGVILAIGRAIGETIAVLMVGGGSPLFIQNIFSPIRTLTVNIAIDMGYASGTHKEALFSTALVLLLLVIIINSIKHFILSSSKRLKIK